MIEAFDIQAAIRHINELEEAVRNHINTHRHQAELLGDKMTWNQICSSLDAIGDALMAIGSYVENPFPEDIGLRYIFTYGILQALFLQQDALSHLAEALDVKYKRSETLTKIRRIRNAAIGHPTKQTVGEGKDKERYYNYVSRISMAKGGFDLMRHSEKQPYAVVHVDLSKAIEEQLAAVTEGYGLIVKKLEELERIHKQQFQGKLLVDCFPDSMTYHLSKVGEGIHSGQEAFALANLRMVQGSYQRFRQELDARKELNEYTDFDLSEYFHAIDRLQEYLSNAAPQMKEHDARIYLTYLRTQHEHFVEVAEEVDEEYKS
jgi:hypothetical protein